MRCKIFGQTCAEKFHDERTNGEQIFKEETAGISEHPVDDTFFDSGEVSVVGIQTHGLLIQYYTPI